VTVREPDTADTIYRLLRPQVTPEPDTHVRYQDLTEYGCSRCQERCINPKRSMLAEAGVCLQCHICYAVHGNVKKRLSGRWENRRPDPPEDRSPEGVLGDPGPSREATAVQRVFYTGQDSERRLHANLHCRYLGAANLVKEANVSNPPRGKLCSHCFPEEMTTDDLGGADE
jgi:hypothetical protein